MSDATLDLLGELVSIPSHVSQPDGIAAIGARMAAELGALGFERQPSVPVPAEHRAPAWAEAVLSPEVPFDDLPPPTVWHRAGEADGTLLILGDLDAALALPPDACHVELRDGRAIGPAVADMKGGLVVLTMALGLLAAERHPLPSLTVVLAADEQAGSLRSAATIREHARTATWCICLECAREGGRLMRSRGHIGVGRLHATGTESHAGSARELGVNAISVLATGLLALDRPGVTTDDATVTATMLSGGRRRSLVPGSATAVLDVRARDDRGWAALEARISSALSAVAPASRLRLDLFNHRPGLPATANTAWFLGLVREVGDGLGIQVSALDSLAAGSSAFVDSTAIPVLDGMGPAGGALMTPEEYVEVDSLTSRGALLAGTIRALGAARG